MHLRLLRQCFLLARLPLFPLNLYPDGVELGRPRINKAMAGGGKQQPGPRGSSVYWSPELVYALPQKAFRCVVLVTNWASPVG